MRRDDLKGPTAARGPRFLIACWLTPRGLRNGLEAMQFGGFEKAFWKAFGGCQLVKRATEELYIIGRVISRNRLYGHLVAVVAASGLRSSTSRSAF